MKHRPKLKRVVCSLCGRKVPVYQGRPKWHLNRTTGMPCESRWEKNATE